MSFKESKLNCVLFCENGQLPIEESSKISVSCSFPSSTPTIEIRVPLFYFGN